MNKIIIVNNPKDWNLQLDDVEVVSARTYLTDLRYTEMRKVRVFNLCRQYRYQATGYYVSLLAEARGHKAIPSITTIQDLKSQAIVRVISDEIDELIQKSLKKIKSPDFTLSIYFSKNVARQHEELSKALYNLFQAPLIRAHFVQNINHHWVLQSITPIPVNEIPDHHKPYLEEFAKEYFSRKRFMNPKTSRSVYELAILVNPKDTAPPSDKKAMEKFLEAAEEVGFSTQLITKDDYSRLSEFDALFIRETTSVNHHTYRFARRAHADGLAVIDDPVSILRCTNKVYLAEILAKAKIPVPKTVIVHKDNRRVIEENLGLPCVLKKPDSSFSHGVVKVKTAEELNAELDKMLASSDLIIAQEFLPTDFDWRIGILDQKPLYACKYFMAKGHWQIYNWQTKEQDDLYGMTETVPVTKAPRHVVQTALKAANLIGNGLYGVDLKEIDGKAFVIEINDNPSIDAGIEDEILNEELYLSIMNSLKVRIEKNRQTS